MGVAVLPLMLARPPPCPGIDLRCCDVTALLTSLQPSDVRAQLVVADPPWQYHDGVPGHGRQEDYYDGLPMVTIMEHLALAATVAASDSYLALWTTWPMLAPVMQGMAGGPWEYVSGGSWHKDGQVGIGYHWRGVSEPLLLWRKGRPHADRGYILKNGHASYAQRHSEKPVEWARGHIRAWVPPGGLMLDLYAGYAPYARAAKLEGRDYIGAEIDPERHAAALTALAQVRHEPER